MVWKPFPSSRNMVVEELVSQQGCFSELHTGPFPDAFPWTLERASDFGNDVDANIFFFFSESEAA